MMTKARKLPHKIYVFGNTLLKKDSLAVELSKKLKKYFPKIDFAHLDPNEEIKEKEIIILDVADGIKKVSIIKNINQLKQEKRFSLHDFDVGFSLKLMEKIGLIKKIKIIAIPINYNKKKAYEEVKREIKKLPPLHP